MCCSLTLVVSDTACMLFFWKQEQESHFSTLSFHALFSLLASSQLHPVCGSVNTKVCWTNAELQLITTRLHLIGIQTSLRTNHLNTARYRRRLQQWLSSLAAITTPLSSWFVFSPAFFMAALLLSVFCRFVAEIFYGSQLLCSVYVCFFKLGDTYPFGVGQIPTVAAPCESESSWRSL